MRCAYLVGPRKFELREVAQPSLGQGQVLGRVLYNSVCGSEFPAYLGICTTHPHYARILKYPMGPFGHEAVSRVEEVSDGVEGFEPGDIVLGGGYYEYCALDAAKLLKLPEGIEPRHAALTMAALETLGAAEQLRASRDDEALILGAGPMGLMLLEQLREKGCKAIVMADLIKWRLEAAKELGATGTIDVSGESLEEGLKELLPEGPSIAIDTTAKAAPIKALFKAARRFARIGLYARPIDVLDRFEVEDIFHKQLEVHGLKARDYSREIRLRALEMIRSGKIHAERLITHVFPLEKIGEAFETAAVRREGLKVLVQCGERT